jgi:phosphatidylglycerophosphate synthase
VHKSIINSAGGSARDSARPAAIEDPSNLWLVHAMSWRLLPLALRLGIHPNTVSFSGMGCGLMAGLSYWHWREPRYVVMGFLLMVAWHVMDGLDGKLARASGKASPLGRVIDGVCDYLAFLFVLLPIALSFDNWQPVLALAFLSAILHALQSAWYEAERDAWKRRLAGNFTVVPRKPGPAIAAPYDFVEARFNKGHRAMDAALAARPALLPAYLDQTAPLVRRLSILSANNRTIAIAVACLAGDPRLYWYWEIGALTLFAVLMGLQLRRREAALASGAASMLDPAPLPEE